jgi:hypothetical protein
MQAYEEQETEEQPAEQRMSAIAGVVLALLVAVIGAWQIGRHDDGGGRMAPVSASERGATTNGMTEAPDGHGATASAGAPARTGTAATYAEPQEPEPAINASVRQPTSYVVASEEQAAAVRQGQIDPEAYGGEMSGDLLAGIAVVDTPEAQDRAWAMIAAEHERRSHLGLPGMVVVDLRSR